MNQGLAKVLKEGGLCDDALLDLDGVTGHLEDVDLLGGEDAIFS